MPVKQRVNRGHEVLLDKAKVWIRDVDWPIVIAKVGVFLAFVPVFALFWAANGGFSVVGLQTISEGLNTAGQMVWGLLSSVTFQVHHKVPGLPIEQPLLPWLGVLGASITQTVITFLKLQGRDVPTWLWVAGFVLSGYDLTTTFFGLGRVALIAGAGYLVQGLITIFLTFSVEGAVGFALAQVVPAPQGDDDDDTRTDSAAARSGASAAAF